MPTYQEVLKQAKKLIRQHGMEASAAELLMLHFSGLKPTELYLNYGKEMPEAKIEAFTEALNIYIYEKKPVQYIIGHVYFYGYRIGVDLRALIPRYETEELVQHVLMLADDLFPDKKISVLDLGTGTGCIAIALKLEEPDFRVFATDISIGALALAMDNAASLGADIEFKASDLFQAFPESKFSIIVSNPPYLTTREKVEEIIFNNEPHLALFGGEDGLDFYRRIIEEAPKHLESRSILAFEHGFDKAESLRAFARIHFPQARIHTEKDMQGKDRMTFIVNDGD